MTGRALFVQIYCTKTVPKNHEKTIKNSKFPREQKKKKTLVPQ